MFGLVRKSIGTVAVLVALGAFFFGRDAFSYVATSAGWLKDRVRNSVPVAFEIERARKLVKDLVPDIRRNMHVIAQEEVEVDRLEKQISELDGKMTQERDEMLRLKTDLSESKSSYEYAGRTYTIEQVKTDLAHRFERFKTHEATLASLKDIRTARTKSLDAARQKLEGMLASKRQLEVDVENLEARLSVIEVAKTTSSYHIDDSQLGRARELIADVRTRLNVAERMVNVEGELQEQIPLEDETPTNIVEQVSAYFSTDAKVAKSN